MNSQDVKDLCMAIEYLVKGMPMDARKMVERVLERHQP